MPHLHYSGRTIEANETETVLECLLRNGENIAHSCLSGICQSCLLKCEGATQDLAQKGLKTSQKEVGLFFACQQKVHRDLTLSQCHEANKYFEAEIVAQERLSPSVLFLRLKVKEHFSYRAGQFVNLRREDLLSRSYSLASASDEQDLHFHIRHVPEGKMSHWLFAEHLIGHKLQVSSPLGECYLNQEMLTENLLLVALGTGLAPLYGILLDAFKKHFPGNITLIQGGLNEESLYYVERLREMEKNHGNFTYLPTYLFGEEKPGFSKGDITEMVKNYPLELQKTHAIVCGDPIMVKKLKQVIFMRGIPSKKIFSDSFVSPKSAL